MGDFRKRPPESIRMPHIVDQTKALAAFQRAAASEREEFDDFFLTRLLGLEISYPGDACEVAFDVQDFMFNPRGGVHGGCWPRLWTSVWGT